MYFSNVGSLRMNVLHTLGDSIFHVVAFSRCLTRPLLRPSQGKTAVLRDAFSIRLCCMTTHAPVSRMIATPIIWYVTSYAEEDMALPLLIWYRAPSVFYDFSGAFVRQFVPRKSAVHSCASLFLDFSDTFVRQFVSGISALHSCANLFLGLQRILATVCRYRV